MPTPRFSRRVIERVAENRIRQAYEEGQFENLPGLGRPLPGIEEPYDPLWFEEPCPPDHPHALGQVAW